MTQFTTGTRVRVTAAGGGLFYSGNKGKVGEVTRTSRAGEIVHVRFDDGVEDYGRPVDIEAVNPTVAGKIVVGSKVKVVSSVVFLGKYEGKTGEVYRVDGRTIYVRFAEGTDYGLIDELVLENAKDENGFISNAGNTTGKLPVARGTKLDVLYNDGTLILDLPVGDGTSKTSVNFPNRSYSATTWTNFGTGNASVKAYRFPSDRPGNGRLITHAEMEEGMQVRHISAGNDQHNHWNFVVGQVYSCGNGGPLNALGALAQTNYGDWSWELVTPVGVETLDTQLAALRAELEAVKAEKVAAEAEVKAAQERVATKVAVVDGIEARRVALVGSLTKHGIQFIGESAGTLNGLQAHEAGILKVGTKLLTVSTPDSSEFTNGREYAVTRVDAHDSVNTYKLESNDGYGHWVSNNDLTGFRVVA
jgi:hypothetical protein